MNRLVCCEDQVNQRHREDTSGFKAEVRNSWSLVVPSRILITAKTFQSNIDDKRRVPVVHVHPI
jgi:hypothetical protein